MSQAASQHEAEALGDEQRPVSVSFLQLLFKQLLREGHLRGPSEMPPWHLRRLCSRALLARNVSTSGFPITSLGSFAVIFKVWCFLIEEGASISEGVLPASSTGTGSWQFLPPYTVVPFSSRSGSHQRGALEIGDRERGSLPSLPWALSQS